MLPFTSPSLILILSNVATSFSGLLGKTKENKTGTSLVAQWLRLRTPSAGGPGSIPG